MYAAFVVITSALALVAGTFFFLWRVKPASVWPYVLACFVFYGSVLLLGGAAKVLFGAPSVFGLVAPFIAIPLAACLFIALNQRALLSAERWWLTLGCIAVAWIYDDLKSVVSLVGSGSATTEKILNTVVASIIDAILACILVAVAAALAGRVIASGPDAPSNNRSRGP